MNVLEDIKEIPAQLLNVPPNAIHDYFNFFIPCQSFLISNIETLSPTVLKTLFEIMSKGKYEGYDYNRRCKEIVAVYAPIVMTVCDEKKIPKYFKEKIDHIVQLENYTEDQLELIVLQRLKYAGLDYKEEKVMWLIVEYGHENIHDIIRLLRSSITAMLAENRSILTVDDVKKVMAYS